MDTPCPSISRPLLVSIVIPCWNGERYLAQAIESILRQRYEPLEIIVVDDGSTDRSTEVARSFGDFVKVVVQAHAGAAAARNRGVGLAQGELIAFLDADDLWTEGRLTRQVQILETDPEVGMVMGHTQQFISPDVPESLRHEFRCETDAWAARLSGVLVARRSEFDRVGEFSTQWGTGEFMDWYLRAEELGVKCVMLPDVVLRRRLHGANHGVRRSDARRDYVRVIKAALDRRRGAPSPPGPA